LVTALLWLRRDLRVHDHPALRATLEVHDQVVPVFCFDDRLLHGRHASGPRTQFLLECLADLKDSLRGLGSRLVLRHGPPERELPRLAREVAATAIHFTEDVGPFARRRDHRVARACREAGIELAAHAGLTTVDDVTVLRTRGGRPYTVFSPFYRRWLQTPRRDVFSAPRELPGPPSRLRVGRLPGLRVLGLEQEVPEPLRGGEREARKRLRRFLRTKVRRYGSGRDDLGEDATSRLSPYLHLGCLSAREVEELLPRGEGAEEFRRQLCWRDFHHHVLRHHPRNARSEYQDRYRGSIRWSHAKRDFGSWTEGRTGYPLVDAAMRQLRREGWIPNRARLVVASFLTKDLGIDWRWGERWFMRMLIDGDEANNNGNWQWTASVGVDPQPPARRLYNPTRQLKAFDPHGAYVRRHLPELRNVPDEHLAEPWTMPIEVQRAAGCVIGEDYPAPIVFHLEARRAALARYAVD
jgi:deoxyribodipyrimidine photo-lyase